MYKIYNELKQKENLKNIVTNFLDSFKSNIPDKEIEIINLQFNKILKEHNIYDEYLKEITLILEDFNNYVIPQVEQHRLKLKENEEKQKCFNNIKNEIQYNRLLSLLKDNPKIVQYSGNCYEDLIQFLKKNKIKITPEQGKILAKETQDELKKCGIQNTVEKIGSLESFKKRCFIDFIKSNETFKKLLKNTEQLSMTINNKTTEEHIYNMIGQFNPYQKNTDFVATIAFLNLLQKHPELIKNKSFINPPNEIGFTDEQNENKYTVEQLKINKDTILLENPFMLGIITKCCLGIGATGGNFSLYSILNPNASFVVVKKNEKPISHALIWVSNDNKTLVIDSIDLIQNFANDLINENNLLAFLYNDFAGEFLQSNPQIEQINMSIGGNTLKAIQFKKDYPLQIQLYSKKGKSNIIRVSNKNQPTQFCLLQEVDKELKLINKDTDLSDFNKTQTDTYNEKLFEININSLLEKFNKQETNDNDLKNLLDLLFEVEKAITKSTGWGKTSNTKQPADGDIYSLNESSIHGVTFNSQMTMQGV